MGSKDIVGRSNIEQFSLERYPTKVFFTTSSQSKGIQQIEEQGKYIHLPIVSCSVKVNIPLMRVTRELQMIGQTE
jgi:hypothetical protein